MRRIAAWLLCAAGAAHAAGHDRNEELAQVHSYLRTGEYRAGLALAAHVAAEHRDAETVALYAGLLEAGGRPEHARQLRASVEGAVAPASAAGWPPSAEALPPGARIAGQAVLVDARHAVVPAALVPDALLPGGRLWVRNALGQVAAATALDEQHGLRLLALEAALPWNEQASIAPREPFAGSPGFLVAHAAAGDAAPAWPRLHAGFVLPQHRLGVEAPPSVAGAPVFDAQGRLAGIALGAADGQLRWQPLPPPSRGAAPSTASPRLQPEEVYERALGIALQLIAAD